MLLELHLRNLGVITEASVAFVPGLNVVTGETGAGKTLLVTSLLLVAGGRAPPRIVTHEAEEASVEAVVAQDARLATELSAFDVEGDDEIVLARRVRADGRTRAWLNGRVVPVSVLGEIGARLVEVHGQGAGFALAHPSTQLEAVDVLAGNGALLKSYREALATLRSLQAEREQLARDEQMRSREAELLAFQAGEIERAALRADEEEEIASELVRLEHAERFAEIAGRTLGLAGAEGAAGLLTEAHRTFEDIVRLDPSVGPIVTRLGEVAAEAAESAWDVRNWAEGLDSDPSRLTTLRERKALIAMLKRKYGDGVADVIRAGADARTRLADLEQAGARAGRIDAEEAEALQTVEHLAGKLSGTRRKAARKLTKLVTGELPALALPNANFEVECTDNRDFTEAGRDHVSFQFSESRKRPLEEIGKVASGGELSRAMIAVTLALAHAHAVPVLVFDEADQGLGGEAALELARRLARLGRTHQVLVVSHLPQIAAFADRHITVRKSKGGVEIGVVEEEERLSEISRMLAGLGSSVLARGHAAELIELAKRERPGRQRARVG